MQRWWMAGTMSLVLAVGYATVHSQSADRIQSKNPVSDIGLVDADGNPEPCGIPLSSSSSPAHAKVDDDLAPEQDNGLRAPSSPLEQAAIVGDKAAAQGGKQESLLLPNEQASADGDEAREEVSSSESPMVAEQLPVERDMASEEVQKVQTDSTPAEQGSFVDEQSAEQGGEPDSFPFVATQVSADDAEALGSGDDAQSQPTGVEKAHFEQNVHLGYEGEEQVTEAVFEDPVSSLQTSPAITVASLSEPRCEGCDRDLSHCCCHEKWMVSVDWLYLQPRGGSNLAFSFPTNICFGPPQGKVGQIDYDNDSGVRWSIARALSPCSWLSVSGTHFEADVSTNQTPAPGTFVQPLLLVFPNPLTCDAATSAFARARSELRFDHYDIDYGQALFQACGISVNGLVGVRIAEMDQSLRVDYDQDSVRTGIDLRGAGPRAGVGGRKDCGSWHFNGDVALSLISANVDASYKQNNAISGLAVDVEQSFDRIVPVLDLETSIACDLTQHVTLAAGYQYSIWFNMVTQGDYISSLQHGNFNSEPSDTITFDGVFARVQVCW